MKQGSLKKWGVGVPEYGRNGWASLQHSSALLSDAGFLSSSLHARGFRVFACFVFVVTFSNLLLDFLNDEIDGGVKIAFTVLGKKVGAGHGEANGTGELLFRRFPVVMFQGHPRVQRAAVQMVEFFEAVDEVVFDGFRKRQVVRRKNQFHSGMMVAHMNKIQPKSFARLALRVPEIIVGIMRPRFSRRIGFAMVVAAYFLQPTFGNGSELSGVTPPVAAPKEQVSPWLRTKTNEWVRYHYPRARPAVYQVGGIVQPQVILKGWFETNNTPPVAATRIARTKPPIPLPNLDDPKSLRQYAIRNGFLVPEIVTARTAGCSGGT